jgi:NAD(P)-dependent dehydrogenase (short-subunit alcohol dehydrogenase family)
MVRRTLKKVMGPIYGLDKTEEELLEQVASTRVPMRRLGRPREIADAIAFFLSDFSSFATGQVLVVGGGT